MQKLAKKVLDFVKTNQFETQLATDMISSLIAQMAYVSQKIQAILPDIKDRDR